MKLSKDRVRYRPAQLRASKRCGTCSMFRGLGLGYCTLVRGVIRSSDVCDRWEKR